MYGNANVRLRSETWRMIFECLKHTDTSICTANATKFWAAIGEAEYQVQEELASEKLEHTRSERRKAAGV